MKIPAHLFAICTALSLVGCSSVSTGPKDPWEQTRRADTRYSYERYLREHPDTAHSAEAKNRIEALRFEEVSREEYVAPNQYRTKCLAVLRDVQNGYEKFLADYPQSVHSPQAQTRLKELRQEEDAYRLALGTAVSGDVSAFLTFLRTHPRYSLTDVLARLRRVADDNCVKSLGGLLASYDAEARKKTYPLSVPGMVFLGPWSDGQARIDVIDALRETRKKSAIPHIIASLTDPEQAVSTYGMNYLRGFTGPATYYYPVREAAAKALKEMTGQDFGADQQQWTNWWRNTAQ